MSLKIQHDEWAAGLRIYVLYRWVRLVRQQQQWSYREKKTTLLSIFSTSSLSRKKTLKIFFSVHLKGINSSDADSKSFCHFSMKSKVCCMLLASLVNSTLDSMFLDVSVYLPADEVHWEENWEWNKVRNEKENCILLNFSWKIFLRISIYFMLDLDRSALWNIFELLLGFL